MVVDFEKAPQDHYSVFFPDLPGYVSMGNDLQHTHSMAKEALGLHLWGFERDNEEIPSSSTVDAVQGEYPGKIIGLVEVSLLAFRAKLDTRAVKKTLIIRIISIRWPKRKRLTSPMSYSLL